jgi:FkbM family methyltransferase
MMDRKIHTFTNGVKVYDDHLVDEQRKRYAERNVHEADEEDIFVAVIHALPENGCYVNVGAAIGYYCILARKLSPDLTVHAYEPLTSFKTCFQENILLNGFAPRDFYFHEQAVAASNGYARLENAGYASRLNARVSIFQARRFVRQILNSLGTRRYKTRQYSQVKTVSLETAVKAIGRSVDLLQMDIQGLESEVLEHGQTVLQTGSIQTFLIGTHGPEIHRSCLETLKRCGYTIELEEQETKHQPDGIILASRGVTRLQKPRSDQGIYTP